MHLRKYNGTSVTIFAESVSAGQANAAAVEKPSGNNPIVLVLVDGTSHKLHNALYHDKCSGGAEIVKRFRFAVRERVAAMLPTVAQSEYHIVIKFFACLKSLSNRAAADKLIYPGVRSLASYFTGFTKAGTFCDFVDTGDEGCIPHRISETLKLYMANEQCKHVFFCAAGSPKYHSALEEYRGQTRRVTPVAGSVANENLSMLGLYTVSFGKVFKAPPPNSKTTPQTATDDQETLQILRATEIWPTGQQRVKSTVKPTSGETSEVVSTSAIAVPPTNDVNSSFATGEVSTSLVPSPLPTRVRHGRVPINLAKQRLDLQIQVPTPAELQAYKEHTKIQELCIDFHLRGYCITGDCKLSHGALNPGVFCVLQYKALGMPCPKGSGCRDLSCVYAHICQKWECNWEGGKASLCGLDDAMHMVDPHVTEWVVADDGAVQSSTTAQRHVVPTTGALMNDGVSASFMEDLISF